MPFGIFNTKPRMAASDEFISEYDRNQGADLDMKAISDLQPVASPTPDEPVDNVSKAYNFLTGPEVEEISGGKIKPLSAAGASGLIGSWQAETGKMDLTGLDVIEEDARAGRGLSQYTGPRRDAYEEERSKAIAEGIDPNSWDFQKKYFVEEYLGKHDPAPGRSLIGYTNSLAELDGMDVNQATTHLTDDFFRPSKPHLQKRIKFANAIYNRFNP